MSLSSWRAWIEIFRASDACFEDAGRSPHGERGLKFSFGAHVDEADGSLSSWRAWIEIGDG